MQVSRQAGAEPCWSSLAGDALYWESWGEQHAVYNTLSGETHLLPDFSSQVLRKLSDHACTARELVEVLCAESNESCDDGLVMDITRLLQQLHAAGLVEKSAT